jgi:hypothetical protein
MTEKTIDLDERRGMAAQKATDLRRLLAEKARYLLNLFSATPAAQDPRRQKLIAAVLDDFKRLSHES